MALVGYRQYVLIDDDAHVRHIHARRSHVGASGSASATPLLTFAAIAVGAMFGGLLWGIKGAAVGSVAGVALGAIASSSGRELSKT